MSPCPPRPKNISTFLQSLRSVCTIHCLANGFDCTIQICKSYQYALNILKKKTKKICQMKRFKNSKETQISDGNELHLRWISGPFNYPYSPRDSRQRIHVHEWRKLASTIWSRSSAHFSWNLARLSITAHLNSKNVCSHQAWNLSHCRDHCLVPKEIFNLNTTPFVH